MENSIRSADDGDLPRFVDYVEDHVSDNGVGKTPLFQPLPRGADWRKAEKLALFREGIAIPVGQSGWRRFWLALDPHQRIIGHADLKARAEPLARHRAMVGMGVHRDHRRKGLGRALLRTIVDWATNESVLEWIDLEVFAANAPARALYDSSGFQIVATVRDMYRVDGESIDHVLMSKRLR